MGQHPAIGVENLGFGHKAYIAALVVLYRQIQALVSSKIFITSSIESLMFSTAGGESSDWSL